MEILGERKLANHHAVTFYHAFSGGAIQKPDDDLGLGRAVFEQEPHSAAEWFGHYPSFSGLAIHYYQSFQKMMAAP